MDEDEDSQLPLFRHFTREDLAAIENIIFEKKLREKKKAQRKAQNIAVCNTSLVYIPGHTNYS